MLQEEPKNGVFPAGKGLSFLIQFIRGRPLTYMPKLQSSLHKNQFISGNHSLNRCLICNTVSSNLSILSDSAEELFLVFSSVHRFPPLLPPSIPGSSIGLNLLHYFTETRNRLLHFIVNSSAEAEEYPKHSLQERDRCFVIRYD